MKSDLRERVIFARRRRRDGRFRYGRPCFRLKGREQYELKKYGTSSLT